MNTLVSALTLLACVVAITEVQAVFKPWTLGCPAYPLPWGMIDPSPPCRWHRDCDIKTERCCKYGLTKVCKKGLVTKRKAGRCPVGTVHPFGQMSCMMDHVGCKYDSQCEGKEKCCKNINCGYKECQAPRKPKLCRKMTCTKPTAVNCKLGVELYQPNGPECYPICKTCKEAPKKQFKICGKAGCPFTIHSTINLKCAKGEEIYRPNGPDCTPICKRCKA